MEYRIIQSVNDLDEFQKEVNDHINDGWQLYGDLSVVGVNSPHERFPGLVPAYCQAVTRG